MEDNTRTESWTEGLTQNGDYWESIVRLDLVLWRCSAPYAYIGPYAYGTSHMRILIWDAHTRMGQHFVPYEYLFACFISLQVFGYCWYK